jgi:protein-S-isoprenylcysteine O-methyltransferase
MGWFWYTVGTQIILGNPICTIGFAFASYKFFAERIEDEEEKLIEFFGQKYEQYRKRTIVGIPAIK